MFEFLKDTYREYGVGAVGLLVCPWGAIAGYVVGKIIGVWLI